MKVAIAGYGVEGEASYRYWLDRGEDVTIVDERELTRDDLPAGSKSIVGSEAFEKLKDFDLVVRTPSLAPTSIRTNGKVWSATNEFFASSPAPIIGVTGTKGKGTTASFITSILREAGYTVHLVGNIGVPALFQLPKVAEQDIVVFELSSFQLWDLEFSPELAVVLMIEPDHLDIHADIADYIGAKANIAAHQAPDDVCIYHPTNELSRQVASGAKGAVVRYGVSDDGAVYVHKNTFFVQDQALCSTDVVQLPGAHNIENACAAISAALRFTDDISAIEQGLRSFSGLPHRLKRVREVRGVTYYDDSISTTPGSAIAALRSFPEPKLLILGGKEKGADYSQLIDQCSETSTKVLAVGANGSHVAELCTAAGVEVFEMQPQSTMQQVAEKAQSIAVPGSIVILSPAAASFDMYKSYSDRGDQFVAAVGGLS